MTVYVLQIIPIDDPGQQWIGGVYSSFEDAEWHHTLEHHQRYPDTGDERIYERDGRVYHIHDFEVR